MHRRAACGLSSLRSAHRAITIPKDFIGAVIGPGGKVIQDIQKTTNTTITITENDEAGVVDIFGVDKAALDGALERIKAIVAVPEVGEVYDGKIKSIVSFGAFVEILPGKEALLHISEIDYKRFETMEETGLHEGDMIKVKLIGVDAKTNKYKLSHKALLPKRRAGSSASVSRARVASLTVTAASRAASRGLGPYVEEECLTQVYIS